MSRQSGDQGRKGAYREMTVAHLRERKDSGCVEVAFLESARFYKLLKQNPAFNEILGKLRGALKNGEGLRVRCTSPNGDVIQGVESRSAGANADRG